MRVICVEKPEKNAFGQLPEVCVGSIYTVLACHHAIDRYMVYELLEVKYNYWTGYFREITPAEEEELQNELIEAL